jgi:hypothetical protein
MSTKSLELEERLSHYRQIPIQLEGTAYPPIDNTIRTIENWFGAGLDARDRKYWQLRYLGFKFRSLFRAVTRLRIWLWRSEFRFFRRRNCPTLSCLDLNVVRAPRGTGVGMDVVEAWTEGGGCIWEKRFLLVDEGRFSRLAVARYCVLVSWEHKDKDYGNSFTWTIPADNQRYGTNEN